MKIYTNCLLILFLGVLLPASSTSQLHSYSAANYTEAENRCFSTRRVLHEPSGKCYHLLSSGPCEEGELLFLDEDWMDTCGKLRSVCRRSTCSGNLNEATSLCPLVGTQPKTGVFGNYHCECMEGHFRFLPDGNDKGCYRPFSNNTPCQEGEVFVVSTDEMQGECDIDPCVSIDDHRSGAKLFVLYEEDGECYELDSNGPCGSGTFSIDPDSTIPRADCLPKLSGRHGVRLPRFCNEDDDGECTKEVLVKSANNFIDELEGSARKNKRRNKS